MVSYRRNGLLFKVADCTSLALNVSYTPSSTSQIGQACQDVDIAIQYIRTWVDSYIAGGVTMIIRAIESKGVLVASRNLDDVCNAIDSIPVSPEYGGRFLPALRSNSIDMGQSNSVRYVNTYNVPNFSQDTYTYPEGSSGGDVNLGSDNTVRYVNCRNVFNKGKHDGEVKFEQDTNNVDSNMIDVYMDDTYQQDVVIQLPSDSKRHLFGTLGFIKKGAESQPGKDDFVSITIEEPGKEPRRGFAWLATMAVVDLNVVDPGTSVTLNIRNYGSKSEQAKKTLQFWLFSIRCG